MLGSHIPIAKRINAREKINVMDFIYAMSESVFYCLQKICGMKLYFLKFHLCQQNNRSFILYLYLYKNLSFYLLIILVCR